MHPGRTNNPFVAIVGKTKPDIAYKRFSIKYYMLLACYYFDINQIISYYFGFVELQSDWWLSPALWIKMGKTFRTKTASEKQGS